MLPWGHAALGYLFYTAYARLRYRHPPVGLSVYALGLGTQFPDLIDKPLAWHFAVLPSGRSLAHSLFTLGVVVGVLWYAFDTPEWRRLTAAFGVGWVSATASSRRFTVTGRAWATSSGPSPRTPPNPAAGAFSCISNSRHTSGRGSL